MKARACRPTGWLRHCLILLTKSLLFLITNFNIKLPSHLPKFSVTLPNDPKNHWYHLHSCHTLHSCNFSFELLKCFNFRTLQVSPILLSAGTAISIIVHFLYYLFTIQHCYVYVRIPFGQGFYTCIQYGLHSHLSHLHSGDSTLISIWYFYIVNPKSLFLAHKNKCFCLDLQVCLLQPVPRFFYMRHFWYFSYKLTTQPFSFQLLSFSLFRDVFSSSLFTVSSLLITLVALTLAAGLPENT